MRLVTTCLILAAMAAPAVAAAPQLAPHRAVYDLALDKASERSGITGLTGRMVYEFNGSPCDGYTVNFRFVTRIDTREASRLTDQQTTTFEDGEGRNFNFLTKTFVDRNLDKELRGSAVNEADGLRIDIEKPEKQMLELEKTQFPTRHLLELIEKAKAGETFYETSLFDGSEDGKEAMITTVVIGKQNAPAASDPEVATDNALLSTDRFWPVDIAYFAKNAERGEEIPEYRISFKLHENGMTRDLLMDYGDFSLKGKLVDLAPLPSSPDCVAK